ncbi:MAG: septum formation initiator family protein [Syntrophomonadaceae bacterium]
MRLKPNRRFRLVVVAVLGAVLLFTIIPRTATIYGLSARKKELLLEKQQLALINEEYRQTLAEIESPLGIERIAREQLGMVKNGERTIIRVIPSE